MPSSHSRVLGSEAQVAAHEISSIIQLLIAEGLLDAENVQASNADLERICLFVIRKLEVYIDELSKEEIEMDKVAQHLKANGHASQEFVMLEIDLMDRLERAKKQMALARAMHSMAI